MNRRSLIRLSVLAAPFLAAGCVGQTTQAPVAAQPASTFPVTPIATVTQAQVNPVMDASFGSLINGVRATAGAPALSYNALLDQAAQLHADDMVANGYFSHRSLDGTTVGARVSATGYKYKKVGENIAQGQQTEQAALDGWVGSPGHQRNNVDPEFEQFGLGRSGTGQNTTWVLVLADPE